MRAMVHTLSPWSCVLWVDVAVVWPEIISMSSDDIQAVVSKLSACKAYLDLFEQHQGQTVN